MRNRWKPLDTPGYYIFDSATQLYLSSQYEWSTRGARIPDLVGVRKAIRVIAERSEEASRPKNWEKISHEYQDLPAAQFIPNSIAVTDDMKSPILQAKDIATQFVIMVWKERTTN